MHSELYKVYINADLSMFAMLHHIHIFIHLPFRHKQEGRKKLKFVRNLVSMPLGEVCEPCRCPTSFDTQSKAT